MQLQQDGAVEFRTVREGAVGGRLRGALQRGNAKWIEEIGSSGRGGIRGDRQAAASSQNEAEESDESEDETAQEREDESGTNQEREAA